MLIYVLNKATDYEGEQTLGLFSSTEMARAQALRHAAFNETKVYRERTIDRSGALTELDCGSTQYVIREITLDAEIKL